MTSADLVVAYNFPPFADASAVTVSKRIVQNGLDVDVLCQDMRGVRPVDESLWALVEGHVRRLDVIGGAPRFLDWGSMRGFVEGGRRRLQASGRQSCYERVYSRSMWPHSHVLAGAVRLSNPSIFWRAEFSDPLLRHVDGQPRLSPLLAKDSLTRELLGGMPVRYQTWVAKKPQLLRLVQALTFALADELVFTNDQQRDVMLGDLDDDKLASSVESKCLVSPHPSPPAAWLPSVSTRAGGPSGRTAIGYFGSLYANRGFGTLVEAIRLLPAGERDKLAVVIHTDQRKSLSETVQRAGVADVVALRPGLPYSQFLADASTFDYLLVADTQGGDFPVSNPFLPSKLSDYLATGVPIFAIVSDGSELARRRHELVARVSDVRSVRSALLQAAAQGGHR